MSRHFPQDHSGSNLSRACDGRGVNGLALALPPTKEAHSPEVPPAVNRTPLTGSYTHPQPLRSSPYRGGFRAVKEDLGKVPGFGASRALCTPGPSHPPRPQLLLPAVAWEDTLRGSEPSHTPAPGRCQHASTDKAREPCCARLACGQHTAPFPVLLRGAVTRASGGRLASTTVILVRCPGLDFPDRGELLDPVVPYGGCCENRT